MKRQDVNSSMIKSVGYDEITETLEVEFNNGQVWEYINVPELAYDEMMSSGSIGRYFHKNIKSEFPAIKVN